MLTEWHHQQWWDPGIVWAGAVHKFLPLLCQSTPSLTHLLSVFSFPETEINRCPELYCAKVCWVLEWLQTNFPFQWLITWNQCSKGWKMGVKDWTIKQQTSHENYFTIRNHFCKRKRRKLTPVPRNEISFLKLVLLSSLQQNLTSKLLFKQTKL